MTKLPKEVLARIEKEAKEAAKSIEHSALREIPMMLAELKYKQGAIAEAERGQNLAEDIRKIILLLEHAIARYNGVGKR